MTTCGKAHHWRIEEANGKTSSATCLRCGATREFHNGCELDRDVGLHTWHDIVLSGSNGTSYQRRKRKGAA